MKLIIADDHVLFRSGLRMTLETNLAGCEIVECADMPGLLAAIRKGPVDLVIMDLHMPGCVGPSDVGLVRRAVGRTPILALTASTEMASLLDTLSSGASGYVTKEAAITTLLEAIQTVRAGGVYIPRDLIEGAAGGIGEARRPQQGQRLTARQTQVLRLAIEGHANKEIAFRLEMSEGTVKTHLAAIMRLYGVGNRVQLMREVDKRGGLN